MPVNYDKSTPMAAGSRQKLQNIENLDIRIDDCQIMHAKSQKLLGIIIDDNLNWTSRVDYLCAAISSRISLLKQLAACVNIQKKKLSKLHPFPHRLRFECLWNNIKYEY